MTKRRHRAHGPSGLNKSLGVVLANKSKNVKKASYGPSEKNEQSPSQAQQNLASKTHETDVQEFFANAELANAKFEAEKSGDLKMIDISSSAVLMETFDSRSLEELNAQFGHLLRIPRRPKPGTYRNADELNKLENAEFLTWRRQLAKLTEGCGVVVTPFERNLEIWRQLWRVVERSHVVVQVVDARNPMLFWSADLDQYVKEVDSRKGTLVLVNKSDLLTPEQIKEWKSYFSSRGIDAIFWSAKTYISEKEWAEVNSQKPEEKNLSSIGEDEEEEDNETEEEGEEDQNVSVSAEEDEEEREERAKEITAQQKLVKFELEKEDDLGSEKIFVCSSPELLSIFRRCAAHAFPELIPVGGFVIGLVGYPNVGKSSSINRLVGAKKTSVSATPGKTKHFQTLLIDDQITLCDCPGLVMPSFGLSNSEMLLNGILPIAHMRDFWSPTQLLCQRVPRHCFQRRYSLLLPRAEGGGLLQAHGLLTALAFLKGFMSAAGIPDCSRAARLILTDVVDGGTSLKWIAAPPNLPQKQFDKWTYGDDEQQGEAEEKKGSAGKTLLEQLERRQLLLDDEGGGNEGGMADGRRAKRIDQTFFNGEGGPKKGIRGKAALGIGTEAAHRLVQSGMAGLQLGGERTKRHWNRNKREKLRRVYAARDMPD